MCAKIYSLFISHCLFLTVAPVVSPLVMTNADIMAVEDRLEGIVIVADPNTANLTVTARVTSDPCPTVQWSFQGDTIEANSNDFSFDDPCAATDQSSPYIFNLTITNLTAETSGQFSAVFAHHGGNVTLPGLFVTIPGQIEA